MIAPGAHIGSYRILQPVGEGGMGVVFEAVHEQIKRRAAIKVLHSHYASDPRIVTRFFNEALAVNIIGHPSIVSIFECGQLDDGTAFIVMEYLEGPTLTQRLHDNAGRLNSGLLRLARQIASAVAAAHGKSIIHRDLKPDNIMLIRDPEIPGGERVKVLDFGIAKFASRSGERLDLMAPDGATLAGTVMGTPTYMSPEQCRGSEEVTDKADVYALGVILFEMLAGRPPFVSNSAMEVMVMHLCQAPPTIAELNPRVPGELAALVQRMLDKNPGPRPKMQIVAELLETPGVPSLPLRVGTGHGSGTGARRVPTGASGPDDPDDPGRTKITGSERNSGVEQPAGTGRVGVGRGGSGQRGVGGEASGSGDHRAAAGRSGAPDRGGAGQGGFADQRRSRVERRTGVPRPNPGPPAVQPAPVRSGRGTSPSATSWAVESSKDAPPSMSRVMVVGGGLTLLGLIVAVGVHLRREPGALPSVTRQSTASSPPPPPGRGGSEDPPPDDPPAAEQPAERPAAQPSSAEPAAEAPAEQPTPPPVGEHPLAQWPSGLQLGPQRPDKGRGGAGPKRPLQVAEAGPPHAPAVHRPPQAAPPGHPAAHEPAAESKPEKPVYHGTQAPIITEYPDK